MVTQSVKKKSLNRLFATTGAVVLCVLFAGTSYTIPAFISPVPRLTALIERGSLIGATPEAVADYLRGQGLLFSEFIPSPEDGGKSGVMLLIYEGTYVTIKDWTPAETDVTIKLVFDRSGKLKRYEVDERRIVL